MLQIKGIDTATNELELSLVPAGVCESGKAIVAIAKWFKESYPFRAKENCILKNVRAFQRLVDLHCASPASASIQDQAIK